MKIIKILLAVVIISVIAIIALVGCGQFKSYGDTRQPTNLKPIKVEVLLYRFDDQFISQVQRSLERIQSENKDKVEFSFYDAKGDQNIQNKSLDEVVEQGTDLIIVNLVDIGECKNVIDKIKYVNIPVIIFNREPTTLDSIKSYNKALFIGTNAEQVGSMQGKIIVDEWNNNKSNIDKNGDNILQYIMLTGERDNKEVIGRTKYSILTIKQAGINTEELALRVANWNRGLAKIAINSLFFKYGNRIEAIIANNDAMAIGAIDTLQEVGYNKGDISRTIVVVGVDGITEAQDLIAKKFMTGTVLQNEYNLAKALYDVGMNLVSGKGALEGTTYEFDESGVAIRLPHKEYIIR